MGFVEGRKIGRADIIKLSIAAPLLLLAHVVSFIMFAILAASVMLLSKIKGRAWLLVPLVAALAADSFFIIPFLLNKGLYCLDIYTAMPARPMGLDFFLLGHMIFIALGMFFMFKKRAYCVLAPFILLAVSNIIGLTHYIPVLNQIYSIEYTLFFLIISSYLFARDMGTFRKSRVWNALFAALVIINIANIANVASYPADINIFGTANEELFAFSGNINGTYMNMFENGVFGYVYDPVMYSLVAYNVIKYNATTVDTWVYQQTPLELMEMKRGLTSAFREGDCGAAASTARRMMVEYALTDEEYCGYVGQCGAELVQRTEHFCLFRL